MCLFIFGRVNTDKYNICRYHVDPNSVVVDFTSDGGAWYDAVELTKLIAGDNEIIEIDSRLGEEFGALKQIDVSE